MKNQNLRRLVDRNINRDLAMFEYNLLPTFLTYAISSHSTFMIFKSWVHREMV